jgi:GTP cyclohydrolase I
MNENKIKNFTVELLKAIGDNPDREGLKNTPDRFFAACKKLFSGYEKNPKDILTVFDDEKYDEMIVVKNIEFYSTCEHHLIPFFGKAHIVYIPN